MKLTNKTIVITGGTSGVGYELAKHLCKDNTVLVIARPRAGLERLAKESDSIYAYGADLSQPSEYEGVVDAIIKKHGHIDLLINNAAVQNTPCFLDDDFNYRSIQSEIQLNFTAVCALSYLFLPALLHATGQSAIVNINSGLSLAPKTSSAVYCATKAAMDVFSQSLSYQLAHSSVSVQQAFLPLVNTPMTFGRGKGKLSATAAAKHIITGIEQGKTVNNIGKVKLLRVLLAVVPFFAKSLMQKA